MHTLQLPRHHPLQIAHARSHISHSTPQEASGYRPVARASCKAFQAGPLAAAARTSALPPPLGRQAPLAATDIRASSNTADAEPVIIGASSATSSPSGQKRVRNPGGCSAAALAALPLEELQRLQQEGLGLQDKIKLGRRGVAEGIVLQVRQRWNTCEAAKLYCHGKHAADMKAVVQQLEEATGGLVVFRAGGTVVLYRGQGWRGRLRQQLQQQQEEEQEPQKSQQAPVAVETGGEGKAAATAPAASPLAAAA